MKSHPYDWVIEPLLDEPSYIQKPMFGCVGCYVSGLEEFTGKRALDQGKALEKKSMKSARPGNSG